MNFKNYSSDIQSYRMMVQQISVDGDIRTVDKNDRNTIERDATHVRIYPEVVNYSVNDPYVSYYLEGFDDEPTIVHQSELTAVDYTNLPVGKYTFHLAILDNNGDEIVEQSDFRFTKENEIYDYWWFRLYIIAIFLLAVTWVTWVLTRLRMQRQLNFQKKELELAKEQVQMGNETILAIAKTVDAKDVNTSQHSRRVSEYSVLIAERLGYTQEQCDNLRKIALLHDIGKIGIPDAVLNKPGKLTDEEYAIMKSHVSHGAEILKGFTLVENVTDGVLYHHERYDGKGYVHGLKGEEIPLNGRIICMADAFDAMTANRVYRKKLDFADVRAELVRCRGAQFDPKITDIMLSLIDDGSINVKALYDSHGVDMPTEEKKGE